MLDQRTWRQTDISSQTVFTNYLTQWWLLGHGSCTWCTVRRQGGPFCCSSLRPRTHLNVCCSGSRTHTDTPTLLTYTSQNSNFKGRAVPVPVKSEQWDGVGKSACCVQLYFRVFFPVLACPTSLVSVSCVLSHVHVLFAEQLSLVLLCLACIGWRTEKMCEGRQRRGASIIERPRPRVWGISRSIQYPVSSCQYRVYATGQLKVD